MEIFEDDTFYSFLFEHKEYDREPEPKPEPEIEEPIETETEPEVVPEERGNLWKIIISGITIPLLIGDVFSSAFFAAIYQFSYTDTLKQN